MGVHRILSSDVRAQLPAGTVLHNPVTGEYARVVEHTPERVVGELLAVPGAAVAGPHIHRGQEERFEVLDGVMGYRRDTDRGELRAGRSVTVPPGVVHDWWNAGESDLRARVPDTPGRFAAMIAAVWGLAVVGRTSAKGMPGPSTRRCWPKRSATRLSSNARPELFSRRCPHRRTNRSSARSIGDPRGDARGNHPA